MSRIIFNSLIFILVFGLRSSVFSPFVYATSYYLSNSGSDSNSGTSSLDPWQTITQLNTVSLQPGDSVFFEAGSIFRGQIVVASAGTESAPIFFGMYGSGNLPIISGAEPATGWTLFSGSIYSVSFATETDQLFSNDVRMTSARYPDNGFLTMQSVSGNDQFTDINLTQTAGYWDGASVRLRTSDKLYEMNKVSSYNNSTVLLNSSTVNTLNSGYGYYFDNVFSELTVENEWYYDDNSGTLYFFAPGGADPNTLNVEASAYDLGMELQTGTGFIHINHLRFEKQIKSGIEATDSIVGLQISECEFKSQGERGVKLMDGASQSAVSKCNFEHCLAQGIGGKRWHDVLISENEFLNIGLQPGYGINHLSQGYAIDFDNSDSVTILRNKIDTTGNGAMLINGNNCIIEKNVMHDNIRVLNNTGTISLSGPDVSNILMKDNFIFYSSGNNVATPSNAVYTSGVTLNDSCDQCLLDHNTIVQTSGTGIYFLPGSKSYQLKYNLIYGCTESQVKFEDGNNGNETSGNSVVGNVLYSLHENQDNVKIISGLLNYFPAISDSNYYFNPYDFYAWKQEVDTIGDEYPRMFTLQQWQNYSGNDLHSHSTYFFKNRYQVESVLGDELIVNGEFTNNLNGWNNSDPDSLLMLLDNSTPLDFGCMKLQMKLFDPFLFSRVRSTFFPMDSGIFLQSSFSCFSESNGNIQTKFKKHGDGYGYFTPPRFFPFDNNRKDYSTIILSTTTFDPCRFDFELSNFDTMVWVDNVSLKEVLVSWQDPLKMSRLFVNYTDATVTIDLGDTTYFDLDSIQIMNQYDLPPYSSVVLILDSLLLTHTSDLPLVNSPMLFPNPAISGSMVTMKWENSSNLKMNLELVDLLGRSIIITDIICQGDKISFRIPKSIIPGIYSVHFSQAQRVLKAKLMIVE